MFDDCTFFVFAIGFVAGMAFFSIVVSVFYLVRFRIEERRVKMKKRMNWRHSSLNRSAY